MPYTLYGEGYYNSDGIRAAIGDDGFLTVTQGIYTTGAIRVGTFAGNGNDPFGFMRIDNSALTVTNATAGEFIELSVGRAGTTTVNSSPEGFLIVENGSTIDVQTNPILSTGYGTPDFVEGSGTYSGFTVGRDGGGGTAIVQDARVTVTGDGNRVTVARNDAFGTLRIEGGGVVEARAADVGRNNSDGKV
ncbi:MAG: hypothetical protein AAGI70_09915, partial [Pseudomonadota bacterium]